MTKIEWTDVVWNPLSGCTRAGPGCDHCYAVKMTHRLEGMGRSKYSGLTVLNQRGERHFNGVVRTHPDELMTPLGWKKPRMVFVNSMSDLFHKDVPFEFIDQVFAAMAVTGRHTYQILTKRPERMAEYLDGLTINGAPDPDRWDAARRPLWLAADGRERERIGVMGAYPRWPLPNVWLGCSPVNQETFDRYMPHMRRVQAAVRFLSLEPLLGPIEFSNASNQSDAVQQLGKPALSGIDWVIVGGESGAGARPCDVKSIRSIVLQCEAAGVPCFVKQLGANTVDSRITGANVDTGLARLSAGWPESAILNTYADSAGKWLPAEVALKDRKGADMSEWPADIRVRQIPAGHVA